MKKFYLLKGSSNYFPFDTNSLHFTIYSENDMGYIIESFVEYFITLAI